MLQKAYSNKCLSRTNIFKWYDKFCNGQESMDDDDATSRTLKHMAKVHAALVDDRRSVIRMLAERFHIDKETMRKIITEDLGGKKLRVRFVPHVLTSE